MTTPSESVSLGRKWKHRISCNSQRLISTIRFPFTYENVLPHKDSVRLIWLSPGSQNDPLVCDLVTTRLKEMGQYDAISVRVWLGYDEDALGEAAASLISRIDGIRNHWDLAHDKETCKKHLDAELTKDQRGCHALQRMTHLPWFDRVWVLQEIGYTHRATLYWGESEIDWDTFALAMGVDYTFGDMILHSRNRIQTINVAFKYCLFQGRENSSVLSLLSRVRHYEASDPKDRIFAILGHPVAAILKSNTSFLKSHYLQSKLDLYRDVAATLLYEVPSLDVLSCVAISQTRKEVDETPSWVPLWDQRRKYYTLILSIPSCRATLGTTLQRSLDHGRRVLSIRGCIIGGISWRTKCFESGDFVPQTGTSTTAEYDGSDALLSSNNIIAEAMDIAVAKSLLLDTHQETHRASSVDNLVEFEWSKRIQRPTN
ncbi:hypothetical protein K402DRAFT_451144 [Aulographum hederae CBS 113979]|uniref:Heterokaryon incompatibility domain-containing protein n=1 Tax=Aulographum hederae CBS 113979 TaxID=1176131 RepID=A0A6G1HCH3_9PEZI|nr:hypothetical protein K402DRAFT_451144 [Aulographum hederae CBS 113979]